MNDNTHTFLIVLIDNFIKYFSLYTINNYIKIGRNKEILQNAHNDKIVNVAGSV
jgi:hypothetical protein